LISLYGLEKLAVVKLFNSVIVALFRNIDQNLESILLRCPKNIRFAFIRGIIDSDGRVREYGSIEIEMKSKNLWKMKLIRKVLLSINMQVSNLQYRKPKDTYALTIYATPNNKNLLLHFIKSTIPRKMKIIKKATYTPA